MKKIILPLDGFINTTSIEDRVAKVFTIPGAADIISHIRISDAGHMFGEGAQIVNRIHKKLNGLNIAPPILHLDLNLAGTAESNNRILDQYREYGIHPHILTVQSCCSSQTFKELHRDCPLTLLTLNSVPNDMSSTECETRYKMTPTEKIIHDLSMIQEIAPDTINAVVCSCDQLSDLKDRFPQIHCIVTDVRDEWMNNDQQKNSVGVRQAIENGAYAMIMNDQIAIGNPEQGIDAVESVRRTIQEIQLAKEYV